MTVGMIAVGRTWSRVWTRVYTAGLKAETRIARREEIASDVWEEAHATQSANSAGLSILARSVGGVPADVTWRLEQSMAPARLVRATALVAGSSASWMARRGLPGLTTTAGIGVSLIGALLLITIRAGDAATQPDRVAGGILLLLSGLLMLGGMRMLSSRPKIGAAMVVIPVLLLGLVLWVTVVAPLVSVTIAAFVLARARRSSRARRRTLKAGSERSSGKS